MEHIEKITIGKTVLAIIIRQEYQSEGIEFFTTSDFSQQLGYMKRPSGYNIEPHDHNPVRREITWTQEVLYIKSGKVRADFYSDSREYISSTILHSGDVILLASGGHGFHILDTAEIIEVKQGPYAGDTDKTRFPGIDPNEVKYA